MLEGSRLLSNIKEIILSEENKKNIEEIDKKYLRGLKIHYVSEMKEVINISLNKNKVKNYKKLI